jgi:hypothetical protein
MAFVSPWWFIQLRNDLGLPLAGGKIYTYVSDTSIPKPVYYDSELSQPTTNPLILDSAGNCPQFFMESGSYTFHVTDANDIVIATRNNVLGAASSGGTTSADYQIKIASDDIDPGYIYDKLQNSSTIVWDKTNDKIIANATGIALDSFKVKATSADASPGFLSDKIANTSSISLSVSSDKLHAEYTGPHYSQVSSSDTADYLATKFADSPTVTWTNDGSVLSASISTADNGKVKINSADTAKYVEDSIKPGSGIVFTHTNDINGKQIHISTTNATYSGQVKVSEVDFLGYLPSKLVAGTGISLSANNNQIKITSESSPSASLGYVSSILPFTSAIRVANTAVTAITSITISAGIWDVEGNVLGYISPVTSSVNTPGINSNIATSVAFVNDGYEGYASHTVVTGSTRSTPLTRRRITVATNTTLYLVSQARFGEFIYCDFWGNITAQQVS